MFDFFRRNQIDTVPLNGHGAPSVNGTETLEEVTIPKHLFVEDSEPSGSNSAIATKEVANIDAIYGFLQNDFESKGYSDCLVSSDDSYRASNIDLIKTDLRILIERVNTYYEDLIAAIDIHIKSRGRAGLIDVVEELTARKAMIVEHMKKVREIEADIPEMKGLVSKVVLSYSKGFNRGLATLTKANLLNKFS